MLSFAAPGVRISIMYISLGAKIRNPKNNIKKPSQQPQAAYCESQHHLVVDCYRNLIADRKIVVWHRGKTIFLNFVNFTDSHGIGVNHIKPDHCVGKHLIAIKRRTVSSVGMCRRRIQTVFCRMRQSPGSKGKLSTGRMWTGKCV